MPSILDTVTQALGPAAQQQIAQHLGIDPSQVGSTLQAGLPAILAGLAGNAAQPGGLQALTTALDKNHDGSILDDVAGFLGQGQGAANAGQGILGHVLGDHQDAVHDAVAQHAGIDSAKVATILAMAAPVVMGAIGQMRNQQGLNGGALASALASAQQGAARQAPNLGGLAGMAGQLLSSQSGGSGLGGLIGNLLGGKR